MKKEPHMGSFAVLTLVLFRFITFFFVLSKNYNPK